MSARPMGLARSFRDSCGEGRDFILPDARSEGRSEGQQPCNDQRALSLSSTVTESVPPISSLIHRVSPCSTSLVCITSLSDHHAGSHDLSWTFLRSVSRLSHVQLVACKAARVVFLPMPYLSGTLAYCGVNGGQEVSAECRLSLTL